MLIILLYLLISCHYFFLPSVMFLVNFTIFLHNQFQLAIIIFHNSFSYFQIAEISSISTLILIKTYYKVVRPFLKVYQITLHFVCYSPQIHLIVVTVKLTINLLTQYQLVIATIVVYASSLLPHYSHYCFLLINLLRIVSSLIILFILIIVPFLIQALIVFGFEPFLHYHSIIKGLIFAIEVVLNLPRTCLLLVYVN